VPQLPDRLPAFLGPLVALLGEERAQVAHHVINEGLAAVAPVTNLWAAEADVIAERARLGADSAASAKELAERVSHALDDALSRHEERTRRILALTSADAMTDLADGLVAALELDGPVASAEAFDDLMRDPAGMLVLGARNHRPALARDLSRIARRVASPPTPACSGMRTGRRGGPSVLDNADSCGVCVRDTSADAVFLGDGTAVTSKDDRYVRQPAAQFAAARELSVFRIASDQPPVLDRSARAALASCLETRADASAGPPRGLGPRVMFGAVVNDHTSPTTVILRIGRLIRDMAEVESPDAASAILAEMAALIFRVHARLGPSAAQLTSYVEGSPIDVGRVRWCELSDSPILWIPLSARDPDVVGGSDMPWTRQIPSAAASWHASAPSLRLDPTWFARIVVVPGFANMWCETPDGAWWSLDVDFDSMLGARRGHLEPWLAALEAMGLTMPVRQRRIPSAKPTSAPGEKAAASAKPASLKPGTTHKRAPASKPEPFTKEWVLELATRYSYADDTAAQEAGQRAAAAGFYRREDFLTVVRWKSARAVPLAERNTAAQIRSATRAAFAADGEVQRMASMLTLKGVGAPVASALLHFAYPQRYPILDYRALATLGDTKRRTQYSPDFWASYVSRCCDLARAAGVSLRDFDKALWQDSVENS
jgi:hypothetical protein